MKKKISSSSILILFAGFIAVGLIAIVMMNNVTPAGSTEFAQCLNNQGVKMYGAWWCPHCQAQKELFGKAFENINYVECSPNGTKTMSQECKDAEIEGYPTWVFADGSQLGGEQSFADLAEKTGCPLPSEE